MTAFSNAATTAAYEDVQQMLFKICWGFCRHGGDFEEHMSVANEAFAVAYQSHNPNQSASFSTWVYIQVRGAILTYRRRFARQPDRHEICSDESVLASLPACSDRPIEQLLKEISDDAKTIVGIILEAPEEIADVLRFRKPEKIKRRLWKHMKRIGWSLGRVADCFDEIREALCD